MHFDKTPTFKDGSAGASTDCDSLNLHLGLPEETTSCRISSVLATKIQADSDTSDNGLIQTF